MGIFNDNPVLRREMRSRLRLRRVLASRPLLWVAGLTVLVIAYFYVKGIVGIMHIQTQDARELWGYLLLFLLLLIVVVAPALLSTAITQEREQQTWESLASTNLTAAEVLLGKWLARLSLTGLPVLVLLPFQIGCSVKGGIGPASNIVVLLFLALTAAFYGVLGMLCSFFARKTVTATVAALSVTLFLCVGTLILAAVLGPYLRAASADYTAHDPAILWLNPFYVLLALFPLLEPSAPPFGQSSPGETPGAAVAAYLVLTLLAAAGGLLWMTARYRRAARDQ